MDNIKIIGRKHKIAEEYLKVIQEREQLDKQEKELSRDCEKLNCTCNHDIMLLTRFKKDTGYESLCLFCGLNDSSDYNLAEEQEKLHHSHYINVTKLCKTEKSLCQVYSLMEKEYLSLRSKHPTESDKEIAKRMDDIVFKIVHCKL